MRGKRRISMGPHGGALPVPGQCVGEWLQVIGTCTSIVCVLLVVR